MRTHRAAVLAAILVLVGCTEATPSRRQTRLDGAATPAVEEPASDAGRDAARRDAAVEAGATDEAGAELDGGAREPRADAAAGDAGRDAGTISRDAGLEAGLARADGGVECGTWSGRTPIRALFVGNSQIDFWNLPQLVSGLSASAPAECPRVVGDRFTLGGANLRDLWEGADARGRRLLDVLSARRHDVVVIAESIDLVESRPPYPEQFVEYATRMIEAARAASAEPVLYATPYVERPDTTGFRVMADDQLALGRALGVIVATGGLAWLRVWAEAPSIDLYYVDRQHPGYRGSYVSALVIYAAITGASPIGLTHDPPTTACEGGPCPELTPSEAALLQRAAWAEHLATVR